MKFLCAFLVLMLLSMSFTVFTDAIQAGPYSASASVSTQRNWIMGDTSASGQNAVRNGSYVCSIGMEVSPVSSNNINGSFSDGVSHMRFRGAKMFANSDSWGSDINGNNWHASDSDSGT